MKPLNVCKSEEAAKQEAYAYRDKILSAEFATEMEMEGVLCVGKVGNAYIVNYLGEISAFIWEDFED